MKKPAARFFRSVTRWEDLPDDGLPEVAFAGRSNVGKSSLLNALLRAPGLARTSSTPGKTRQLNFYRVNEQLYFVDLPGYGYARTSQQERRLWGRLITRYLQERPTLALVVHLIDSRHPPTPLDEAMMDLMRGQHVPYLIALTKTDKVSGNRRAQAVREVERALQARAMEVPIIPTSAHTGLGLRDLWRWIEQVTVGKS
ncbi:GTP-binding protein engB [Rhodothermus marinus SG0.5JP17-172]|uniref:ribosome biogenesis GTP-binding protein YihA/YsxC n=1 Tax=Rhodothermus marinus TaxID=29549 RepID=UPI000223DE01|nr:ribosome biogenesis GTP-binding protein YihA/YsxC [Rhodothermus marinus]AEN74399.1 GTP-binding protein engB [Rhodothermus marinus SG0.5JP17-172]MBO2492673.1 YihA family ribosome biogenesis GTP-binding protein [Rhodothermus marinus]